MCNYLLRIRDRKNSVLLDQWIDCPDTAEALVEARAALRSFARRGSAPMDQGGRVDVEMQGRPVARLLISEELQEL